MWAASAVAEFGRLKAVLSPTETPSEEVREGRIFESDEWSVIDAIFTGAIT